MNRDRLEGALSAFGGKVNELWGRFTHDARREMRGKQQQRMARTQMRYGASKEAAARQLKDFLDRNSNWHLWHKQP